MLLFNIRGVISQMRNDPTVANELPIIGRSIRHTLIWLFASELIFVLQLLPVKFFMDEIVRAEPRKGVVIAIAISFLLIYKLGQEFRRRLSIWRNDVFWGSWRLWWGYGNRCLLRQSTDWHSTNSTGEKESLVGKNIAKFQNLFDELLFETLPITLRILLTTIFMFVLNWAFGLVALTVIVVYALALRTTERKINPLREDFQTRIKQVEDKGSELTKNWRTIRSLALEETFNDENEQLLRNFWQDEIPRHKTYMKHMLRQDSVLIIGRSLLYFVAGWIIISGSNITIGSTVLAISWMEKMFANFGRYESFQHQLNSGKAALQELVEFMALEPNILSPPTPLWPKVAVGCVEFKNLSFAYPDSNISAICSLNLKADAHTSVAIVGKSGCGKSTLMSLLSREYDPENGQILVDGQNLKNFDTKQYRKNMVSVVSQQIELFDRSILENIRIARKNATESDVYDAAKQSGAHEFILETEHGYNTEIGENGLRLSGGQRQRLAIARALLMKPRILILDEATSALDSVIQAEVQQTINNLITKRVCTIFIIAHRLSTVTGADKVVVMDNGSIVDSDTHDELLKRCQLYQELCKLELDS